MLILYNSQDPVLKRYWMIDKKNRPRAIGYVGLSWYDDELSIGQFDVRAQIGRSHDERKYFTSSFVTEKLRDTIIAADQAL